jgi:hypothetical protein
MRKKKIWPNFPRIIEVFTQKIVTKPSKIWVWDPGSEKNLFRIPDPGVKKAPDPGSATLCRTLIAASECFHDCHLYRVTFASMKHSAQVFFHQKPSSPTVITQIKNEFVQIFIWSLEYQSRIKSKKSNNKHYIKISREGRWNAITKKQKS